MKKLFILLMLILCVSQISYAEDLYSLDIRLTKPVKDANSVNLKSESGFILKNGEGKIIGAIWEKELNVKYSGGFFSIYANGERAWKDSFNSFMLMHPDGEFSPIFVNDKGYRGNIFFKSFNNKPLVLNRILIDLYLRSVVPGEMGNDAQDEALKAQIIASRSFAIANRNKFIDKGYNLDDTTSSQVYFGIEKEDERINKLINETPAQVLIYDNKICNSIFHSVSSGYTENAVDVWGGKPVPYLTNVIDPYSENAKNYNWELQISRSEIEEKLNSAEKGVGFINSISLIQNPITGSANKVIITGSSGIQELTGNKFRTIISATDLKSSWFRFNDNDLSITNFDEAKFKGRGYGHGVGMPQAGAREMAKQGFKAKDILEYYYKGATVFYGWK